MEFDDRRHLVVDDLSDDLFKKVIGYCFCKYDLAGPGCVRMITEDAEELQLSGKELNELNFYTEWSKLFPVLRYFTYDGCRLDFSKEVKHWKCVKNVYGQPVVIRKPIFEEIAKGLSNSDIAVAKWDDILIDYAKNHFAEERQNSSIEYWIGTTKSGNNVKHALNAIVEMAEQAENNCFYFSLGKEKGVLLGMISEVHRDKLDRVHIIDTPGLCIEDVLDILDQQQMNDGRHMKCVIDDVALLSTREQGFTRIEENSVVLKKLNEYSIENSARFICNITVSDYVKSKQEAIHALREYAPAEMFHGSMFFFD